MKISRLLVGVWLLLVATGTGMLSSLSVAQANCEDGHWIEAVLDDGRLVKLEDGSLWEVDPTDTVTTSIWLPISDIIVCGNRLVNEDDNETVHARRLR
jgi:hypothetical protein